MLTATPHCLVCYDHHEIRRSISSLQRGKVKVLRRGRSIFFVSQGEEVCRRTSKSVRCERELAKLHVATPWKEKQRSVPRDTWCQPTKD
ncbi:hypothetical protein NDU88_006155 [Pleurodeles waltl]|uniref:Uncharacterized protein n=1 Tax=Pleurodeles waltl TaxID=8319 RepID=A0AAV7PK31_PLEWA|nr:hypothetical protein NDU88_006155 [Pleurodeles waltl]